MQRNGIVVRLPTTPPYQVHRNERSPFVVQLVQVMSTVATVVMALASYVACASAMNISSVSVLAAACVLAGWLARDRKCKVRHRPIGSIQVEGRMRRIVASHKP